MPDSDLADLRMRVAPGVAAALGRAVELGFLGPMDLLEQIDHALGFVFVVERERPEGPPAAIDLGTGGGVPGLVVGSCWPECRVTLLDAGRRRTDFLRDELMGLWSGNIEVVRGRAEEVGRDPAFRQCFDVVTSRSFGPPAVAAECGSPFLVPGGTMVVSEPPGTAPARWPDTGLAHLGLVNGGSAHVGGRFGYQILRQAIATPDRYPRRTGVPAKRPLF
ncbi:MAG: RsmG family class I SAM-dependent methyltransferase [Acidimicrobiales bacterium]